MFCPRCGTENSNGATFCKNCGASLSRETPIVQPQGGVAAAAAAMPRQKSKKPLIIAIATILIVAIAVAVFFFVNSRGCYVMASQELTNSTGQLTLMTNERANNGMVVEQFHSGKDFNGDDYTTSIAFKELVDGISIPENSSGTYQKNSDGFVTSYEYTDQDTGRKTSISYTYFSPGIIKTRTIENSSFTQITTYNEDGWATSSSMKYKDSYNASRSNAEHYYKYETTDNGRTVLRYVSDDPSSAASKKLDATLELDEHGNIISVRTESGESNTFTYEKVLFPTKMIQAVSRLKG